jgi:hypothetical protein
MITLYPVGSISTGPYDKLKKQNQGHVRRVKALNDKLKKLNQAHVRRLKALNDKLPKFFLKQSPKYIYISQCWL